MSDDSRARTIALEIARAYGHDMRVDVLLGCAVVLQSIIERLPEPDAARACAAVVNVVRAPLVARLQAAPPAGSA